MLELISVHVPKCAGSAFALTLQHAYGEDAVFLDYEDRPVDPSSPMNLDLDGFVERFTAGPLRAIAAKQVVHGHFHVGKYRAVGSRCRRITFLRHPVDRTLSHFFFWQRLPRHGHALHDYVLDRGLSVIEFARLPYIRHFYERVFFGGIDRDAFDFVGSVERFADDIVRLSQLLDRPLDEFTTNVGAEDRRIRRAGDDALRDELSRLLADDVAFFHRWCPDVEIRTS
jgi:hypothetical protein